MRSHKNVKKKRHVIEHIHKSRKFNTRADDHEYPKRRTCLSKSVHYTYVRFALLQRKTDFFFTTTNISKLQYGQPWWQDTYPDDIRPLSTFFDVLLTVHLSITFVNDQLDAQFFYFYNTFITVLYMFRATSCSSSGGQIILIQHLVLSLSVRAEQFSLNLCTGRPLTESDDTRCCINTIRPPDDEHDVARNMLRTVINVL